MSRFDIHFKSHAVVFQHQADHASAFGKARRFTNGQDGKRFDGVNYFLEMKSLGGAHEQNPAFLKVFGILQIFTPLKPPHHKSSRPDFLAFHDAIDDLSEGIRSQHSDDNGRVRLRKCRGRPLHEFREVLNEPRLDEVFRRIGSIAGLRASRCRPIQHHAEDGDQNCQSSQHDLRGPRMFKVLHSSLSNYLKLTVTLP